MDCEKCQLVTSKKSSSGNYGQYFWFEDTIKLCSLHAAASELLEACKQVKEWRDKTRDIMSPQSDPFFLTVNAAIAKAEGGNHE